MSLVAERKRMEEEGVSVQVNYARLIGMGTMASPPDLVSMPDCNSVLGT